MAMKTKNSSSFRQSSARSTFGSEALKAGLAKKGGNLKRPLAERLLASGWLGLF
jgi:hypothetical protein